MSEEREYIEDEDGNLFAVLGDGHLMDEDGDEYFADGEGGWLTRDDAEESAGQAQWEDGFVGGLEKLERKLGRPPTEAEIGRLFSDQQNDTSPDPVKAYEGIYGTNGRDLTDDDERLAVMAEVVEGESQADEPEADE